MLNLEGFAIPDFNLSYSGINLTFDIIDSLNEQTDSLISANIKRYQCEGPEIGEIEISAEENLYDQYEFYMGLYSGSVDLDDMFTSYFPSLIRRSVFLTLYGMLEHDFEKLCNNHSRRLSLSVKLSDFKGSGFERCDLYARKIIGMKVSGNYNLVKKITRLRNSCAHNDARYIQNDGQTISEVSDLMSSFPEELVADGNQVNFKARSLQRMTEVLRNYLKDVLTALGEHEYPNPFTGTSK